MLSQTRAHQKFRWGARRGSNLLDQVDKPRLALNDNLRRWLRHWPWQHPVATGRAVPDRSERRGDLHLHRGELVSRAKIFKS
jgi:hypothetical protein